MKGNNIVSLRTGHIKNFFDDVKKRDGWVGLGITKEAKGTGQRKTQRRKDYALGKKKK